MRELSATVAAIAVLGMLTIVPAAAVADVLRAMNVPPVLAFAASMAVLAALCRLVVPERSDASRR